MVNKAVSAIEWFCSTYIPFPFSKSFCQKRRTALSAFYTRFSAVRNTSFGLFRSLPCISLSGLSSPSRTCGTRQKRSHNSCSMSQIHGSVRATVNRRRSTSLGSYQPCTQAGSKMLSWTAPSSATLRRRHAFTSPRKCSWPSSGLKSSWTSLISRVSFWILNRSVLHQILTFNPYLIEFSGRN